MRKTKVVPISDEGRDKGKHFLLTEMPAMQAEKWAARAFLALAHSKHQIDPDLAKAGLQGMAMVGLQALQGASFEEAEPLLDEMLWCVKIIPDPSNSQIVRPLVDDDIEEIATLVKLRVEVFGLHTDFSLADVRSTLISTSAKTSLD